MHAYTMKKRRCCDVLMNKWHVLPIFVLEWRRGNRIISLLTLLLLMIRNDRAMVGADDDVMCFLSCLFSSRLVHYH